MRAASCTMIAVAFLSGGCEDQPSDIVFVPEEHRELNGQQRAAVRPLPDIVALALVPAASERR